MTATIEQFKQEDYPDRVCCGALEHLTTSGFRYPFSRPVAIGNDLDLKALGWFVTVYERDERTLNLNPGRSVKVVLQYCPFCGKKIAE